MRVFLICLSVLLFTNCYEKARDCKDFKTGVFYREVTIDDVLYNSTFKSMADHKDIHLKILTTTDSSYTYEYSYVGETKKQKGIAYKSK